MIFLDERVSQKEFKQGYIARHLIQIGKSSNSIIDY